MVKALADRLGKPLRSISMSVCVKSTGAMREREPQQRRTDPRKLPGHPSGPGYPACPEHTEKATIWELLEWKNTLA